MKKISFLFGSFALALLLIVACEDDKTNPVAENGSATISGIAYANISELNDTNVVADWNYEFAPAGTVLYARLNSKDLVLVPNPGATYADLYITTTVGTNGAYSFTVPANSKNFTVSITSDDFQSNFVDVGFDTITSPKIFTLTAVEVGNIHNGAIRLENLYFN